MLEKITNKFDADELIAIGLVGVAASFTGIGTFCFTYIDNGLKQAILAGIGAMFVVLVSAIIYYLFAE